MPGLPSFYEDEREQLLAQLAQQRYVLRIAAHGLDDDQARLAPSVSPLSVGGLIKHVDGVERFWIGLAQGQVDLDLQDDYASGFRLGPDETLAGVLERYAATAAATEAAVRQRAIDARVAVPKEVPWFPKDVDHWNLRYVLLHLVEETARHAGHADVVRESIDGATAFPLMAAVEGWEPTLWITPWEPPAARTGALPTSVRFGSVSLDCPEPTPLAAFYAALLEVPVAYETPEFAAIRIGGSWLSFQKVEDYRPPTWPEGPVPQQVHLDFSVADLEAAERRALDSGASEASTQPSPERWRVLVDPAGHPFCLTTLIPE